MKILKQFFLWSWILTIPITLTGGYLAYRTFDRFHTFDVRYNPNPVNRSLSTIFRYERDQLIQVLRVNFSPRKIFQQTKLRRIDLIVPEPNVAKLGTHMPQSGFEYVKGRILIDGKWSKAKIKYRGDFAWHWGWDKKSIRVKTGKGSLFDGLRTFNLQAPKRKQQLNNYLSLQLAQTLGLLAPRTDIVRLYLNDQDKGIHIFVEQPSETTLRNANLMPGDIYRGEMAGKDRFRGLDKNIWLFDYPSLWDKVATNNHYDSESFAPLAHLLELVKDRESEQAQVALSQIMDMDAWGRFSLFESLASTKHSTISHNWRLYYDPWREKFLPLVWDPAGWMWQATTPVVPVRAVIETRLHNALFRNEDFLRARNAASEEFFGSKTDASFLQFVENTVLLMASEIETDPFLMPSNTKKVTRAMFDLEKNIHDHFAEVKDIFMNGRSSKLQPIPEFIYKGTTLKLMVPGFRPVSKMQLIFNGEPYHGLSAKVGFEAPSGSKVSDLSGAIEIEGNSITLDAVFLADHVVQKNPKSSGQARPLYRLEVNPGYYQIDFEGLGPALRLTTVKVDYGDGWLRAEPVQAIEPKAFTQLYSPVLVKSLPESVVWSGRVNVKGNRVLEDRLILQPGTEVRLAAGATLVLKGGLNAVGEVGAPIRFLGGEKDQDPWGALVLSGPGADGSRLAHCEMAGGSGLKGDMFEYSGMLSIHDVKDVVISDCEFRDNRIVDDMVHAVYTVIRLERVSFENSVSDALDLDISKAQIIDSRFDNSGNDAVDLMTTEAVITGSVFRNSGDKGISVGENSQLYAVNNRLVGNTVGVQSKDRSIAILFNHTLTDNKTALHAYKKNWRYGRGGTIFLGKSAISGGEVSAEAGIKSAIQLFDSYLQVPTKGKRVHAVAVDDSNSSSAVTQDLFPDLQMIDPAIATGIKTMPQQTTRQILTNKRGS